MTVQINIHGDTAGDALRELRDLSLGLFPAASTAEQVQASTALTPIQRSVEDGTFTVRSATDEERAAVGVTTGARVRGQPAPGKARRTKAEIAEDEAAEASTGNISTNPENRVGPEDDAETAAQDAADEAEEVEENRDVDEPLTVDDLRQAVGRYNAAFGMEATIANINGIIGCKQSDVPNTQEALTTAIAKVDAAIAAGVVDAPKTAPVEKAKPLTVDDVFAIVKQFVDKFGGPKAEEIGPAIFVDALGTPPDGERFWKRSILPTDQKSLKACLDGWTKALAG